MLHFLAVFFHMICTTEVNSPVVDPHPINMSFWPYLLRGMQEITLASSKKNCLNEWPIPPFSVGIDEAMTFAFFWKCLPRGLDGIRRRRR